MNKIEIWNNYLKNTKYFLSSLNIINVNTNIDESKDEEFFRELGEYGNESLINLTLNYNNPTETLKKIELVKF